MRLIDADTLNARIDKCVGIDCLGLEPVMAIRDVKALISVMHTIDAIPVEWLNQKYAENDPNTHEEDYDYYLWNAIAYILTLWREEQEVE